MLLARIDLKQQNPGDVAPLIGSTSPFYIQRDGR